MATMTIAEQVRAMHSERAAQPANEAMEAFAHEQAERRAAGIPGGVLAAGSLLPDAELLDVQGRATTLHAATGGRPAVVVFYRGAWCPYCNLTLSHYQAHLLPELEQRDVALVAISPQTPDESLSMQQKHELGFAVLSDPGNILAGHVGILTAPTPEARAAQLRLGLDLTTVNADGTLAIPMAATLVLDGDLVLRWIDVHPDYSTRSETGEILTALSHAGLGTE